MTADGYAFKLCFKSGKHMLKKYMLIIGEIYTPQLNQHLLLFLDRYHSVDTSICIMYKGECEIFQYMEINKISRWEYEVC